MQRISFLHLTLLPAVLLCKFVELFKQFYAEASSVFQSTNTMETVYHIYWLRSLYFPTLVAELILTCYVTTWIRVLLEKLTVA
jgi:hypothetical protein